MIYDENLKIYLKEIENYPILDKEEQKRIWQEYKNGKKEAKEKLIVSNLKLIVKIAMYYQTKTTHLKIMDLIQEGNIALIKAIEDYNPEKSALTTYVTTKCSMYIMRAIEEKELEVKEPLSFLNKKSKYNKILSQSQTTPSDDEIRKKLNILPETLELLKTTQTRNLLNIDYAMEVETECEDYTVLLNQITDRELLLVLQDTLSKIEYFMIYYYILQKENNRNLESLGYLFGISKQRTEIIMQDALKKVKNLIQSQHLYRIKLQKLKEKENKNIAIRKLEPIHPLNIIEYMYFKNNLTELERTIYKEIYFSPYKITKKDLIKKYAITEEELLKSLKKIKDQKTNLQTQEFYNFKSQIIMENKTKIYQILL